MSNKKPFKTAKSRLLAVTPRKNRMINRAATRTSKATSTFVDLFHENKKYSIEPSTGNITALRDFGEVKKGDLGGKIDKKRNLSTRNACWIMHGSSVTEKARVQGDAEVHLNSAMTGKTVLSGDATLINAVLKGTATVKGRSVVHDSTIADKAIVTGTSSIIGSVVNAKAFVKNVKVVNGSVISGEVTSPKGDSKTVLDNVSVHKKVRVRIYETGVYGAVFNQRAFMVINNGYVQNTKVAKDGTTSQITRSAERTEAKASQLAFPTEETKAETTTETEVEGISDEEKLLFHQVEDTTDFIGCELSDGDEPLLTRMEEVEAWLEANPKYDEATRRTEECYFPQAVDHARYREIAKLAMSHARPTYNARLAAQFMANSVSTSISMQAVAWVREHGSESPAHKVDELNALIESSGHRAVIDAQNIAHMFKNAQRIVEQENRSKKARAKKGRATNPRPMRGPGPVTS